MGHDYPPGIVELLANAGIDVDEPGETTIQVNGSARIEATSTEAEAPEESPAEEAETPQADPVEEKAADDMGLALMDPQEPADYIEPDWAQFMFHLWDSMDNMPAVLMGGPRGTGKTISAIVYAARRGRKLLIVNCNPDMTAESLVGTPRLNLKKHGGDYWQPGPIIIAAKQDAVLLLDEFNLMAPAAQAALNPLTDAVQNGIFIPYTGERLEWRKPRIICAVNEGYAGTREIQQAFRDRPETMIADYLEEGNEINLIVARTGLEQDICERAVKTANAVRAAAKGDSGSVMPIEFDLSPRALLSFAKRVVAGQDVDRAWREAVLNRIGSSFRTAATRGAVRQISINTGAFQV
jgi:MoxR-like ATPase